MDFPRLSKLFMIIPQRINVVLICLLLEHVTPSFIGQEAYISRDDHNLDSGHGGYRLSFDASDKDFYHSEQEILDYTNSDRESNFESVRTGKEKNSESAQPPDVRIPNFHAAVPFSEFGSLLPQIGSSFDLLRIQYGHWISDEEITDYLANMLRINIEFDLDNATSDVTKDLSLRARQRGIYAEHKIQRDLNKLIEKMDSSYRNFHALRTSTECQDPRPVLFNVSYFYPNFSVIYVPSSLILHRCDSLFCSCEAGQICSSSERELVNWDLFILTVDGIPNAEAEEEMLVKLDSLEFLRTLKFINHTRCECQYPETEQLKNAWRLPFPHTGQRHHSVNKHEGCKVCPNPFNPRRNETGCTCDCFDMQLECLQIKKGEEPLGAEGLRCIEHGTCQKPSCSVGKFDTDNGFCPRKPSSGIRQHLRKRKRLKLIQ